ncbi:hypothetical protein K5X82_16980 [Halosquirtibacter xylanolyticus]|uniref:hypothetical protein n=1 Tax=Halosquirtibacter xylanolyticus TaxID=3374599 RepID=UPI0037495FDB|nr:hypothetical protein K5X82_16980 [Prolixibacteraceae bacterium]
MFLGLDKLRRQGVKKVVVAVPEKSIGGSFAPTALMKYGFFADWCPEDRHNLCTPGAESSKTNAMVRFMREETSEILICTHATLRFAYDKLTPQDVIEQTIELILSEQVLYYRYDKEQERLVIM